MKARALFVTVALVCAAATVGAGAARADTCASDASYRLQLGRLVYASDFLATVRQVRDWESKGLYDRVAPQFTYQAATALPPLPVACSSGFQTAAAQAPIVRASIHRIAVLLSAFPRKRVAPAALWRPVLATALVGSQAAVRLADALGGLTLKRNLLAGQVKTLVAMRKALG